jgi:hypothetical protein
MGKVREFDLAILAYMSVLSASETYDVDWFSTLVGEVSILSTVEAVVCPFFLVLTASRFHLEEEQGRR